MCQLPNPNPCSKADSTVGDPLNPEPTLKSVPLFFLLEKFTVKLLDLVHFPFSYFLGFETHTEFWLDKKMNFDKNNVKTRYRKREPKQIYIEILWVLIVWVCGLLIRARISKSKT